MTTIGWRYALAPKTKRAKASAPAGSTPVASDDAIVLAAVRAAQDEAPGDLLRPAAVRAATALPKARFDAAALRLQSAGKVVLHHHDAAELFPAADREAWVYDGKIWYVGIAMRRGA